MRSAGAKTNEKITPLSPREVFSLLTSEGLLESRNFVTSAVRIGAVSHRNHNFVIESENGPAYFLKQGISNRTVSSIRREAGFYKGVETSFPEFRRYIPGFVTFVPEHCILVLKLVRSAVPLNRAAQRGSCQPFSALGYALALLHSKAALENIKADHRPSPMIVRAGGLTPGDMTTISAAGVELIRTIQCFPDYETVLTSAFEPSSDQSLTHNDFKSGNCLVRKSSNPVILDWEFAALGDPAWDVGCVMADVLSTWLFSMPLGSRVAVQSLPTIALRPLRLLHPSIRSFWQAYAGKRQLRGDAGVQYLLRATKCAGLKLSQIAFEICQHSSSLSATELFFMQTSWNILKRPVEAQVRLFGIPLDASLDEDPAELNETVV